MLTAGRKDFRPRKKTLGPELDHHLPPEPTAKLKTLKCLSHICFPFLLHTALDPVQHRI